MEHHDIGHPDYGTGQKKLGIYVVGLIICFILTVIAFWSVMAKPFSKGETFAIIYVTAFIQFLVQVICFLRLNTQTKQSQLNVMSIIFALIILVVIIMGSLWIMGSLNYYATHF